MAGKAKGAGVDLVLGPVDIASRVRKDERED